MRPLTEFSLGLTGDINAVMNAHNLAMVALTARLQHERNYDDQRLAKSNSNGWISIRPAWKWAG